VVRCAPDVRVATSDGRAWLRWQAGDDPILRQVLPIAGVRLYCRRDGSWFRPGRHLPTHEVPEDLAYRPLHEVLTPAPVAGLPPPNLALRPVTLGLVRDGWPRQTTAVVCDLSALIRWADTVPAPRLAALRAVSFEGRVLVVGKRLPLVPAGERYWGERVLVPLGFRLDPELAETLVCSALALAEDDWLLLGSRRAEVIDGTLLRPLARAGLRLASGGTGP
jgi:hypothetical protein